MSWFGNTLLPVVQDVCCDDPSDPESEVDAPATVEELAKRCEPFDRQVASYIRARYTDSTLPELLSWAGVVPVA